MVALLGVGVGLAVARPMWSPRLPEGALITVDGAVPRPGTYLVDPPTVAAAVQAAGGPALSDDRAVPEGSRVVVGPDGATLEPGEPLVPPPTEPAPAPAPTGPVDLNHASAEELERLPGIGPALAGRIVDHRTTRGPFRSVDELDRVPGIGPATLDRLRPLVEVRP